MPFPTKVLIRAFQMGERSELFSTLKRVEYIYLTEDTFDWQLWIDTEMRRR